MKKIYVFLFLIAFGAINAQTIIFPDVNFKNALLGIPSGTSCAYNNAGVNMVVDINADGEIDQSEALAVSRILFSFNTTITDLTGLEYFTNVSQLSITDSNVVTINTSTLLNLVNVQLNDNQINTPLDFSDAMQLETLRCQNNAITGLLMPDTDSIWLLDCSNNQLTSLAVNFYGDPAGPAHFSCRNNQLTQVDVRGAFYDMDFSVNQLVTLDLSQCSSQFGPPAYSDNPNLVAVNLKNGDDDFPFSPEIPFLSCPNLQYVCVDDAEIEMLQTYIDSEGQSNNVHINSYCTFAPGGNYASISGIVRYDANGNGCDASDAPIQGVQLNVTDENEATQSYYYSNANGQYSIDVVASFFSIAPIVEHPEYFTVSPGSFTEFLLGTENITQDICISPNGTHHNVSVSVLPLSIVRPGEQASYRLILRNLGNSTASGTAQFVYDGGRLDFVNTSVTPSSQSSGQINWTYTALPPLGTQAFDFVLLAHTPGGVLPVDSGTVLASNASVTLAAFDEELQNNTVELNQIAVNSLDPNDKTCLEGNTVAPETVGGYVHYLIRFENTGTANAMSVVVSDDIDLSKFELSTLTPLHGSHPYETRVTGNRAQFYFENINLPFDDANNDGYIAFKIKTLPTLALGDTFSNAAQIFFDYNFPIITNTATTTISEILKTADFAFDDYFLIYPNPAKEVLHLQSHTRNQILSVRIYNVLGQLMDTQFSDSRQVDVSKLGSGIYVIIVVTDQGSVSKQFIKY